MADHAKLGVKVRIIDKTAEPARPPAPSPFMRTLELIASSISPISLLAAGTRFRCLLLGQGRSARARVSFAEIGADLTPYAFLQIFPRTA
jgi:hypothetical protein